MLMQEQNENANKRQIMLLISIFLHFFFDPTNVMIKRCGDHTYKHGNPNPDYLSTMRVRIGVCRLFAHFTDHRGKTVGFIVLYPHNHITYFVWNFFVNWLNSLEKSTAADEKKCFINLSGIIQMNSRNLWIASVQCYAQTITPNFYHIFSRHA